MENRKKYYITTPIYYPSDKLHIGHSYTTVAADALARYKRLKGYDVMFLTGTDEHGQKIQRKAENKGVSPQKYVDDIVSGIKDLWNLMEITNDRFIRTTDKHHEEIVQKIFKKLYDQGDIYKSEYEGWYCTPCESFWTKTQLKEGKCPDCGGEAELTKEESYFFRLSAYQERLIDHIENNPEFIQPVSRKNEMLNNFLRPGLEDIAVSRTTFTWGVPVGFDEKHVVYVWIDALSNYITALGYLTDQDKDYKKYWPADVHLVGKEIVRFHTIIWPAMLMALGEPLPSQVFGHGWLLLDGGKMSKSKGNVVDPVILVNKYGLDAIRYFLLREVPFGSDGVFSNEALINRINSDLANDLGNLVSRTIAMIDKYFAGKLPAPQIAINNRPDGQNDTDNDFIGTVLAAVQKVEEMMDELQLNAALAEIWKAVSRANKYIDETMPWKLAKDPASSDRLANVLYNLAESLRIISIIIQPFMPATPSKIYKQLGIDNESYNYCRLWESASNWGLYPRELQTGKSEVLFPRIDLEKELGELGVINAEKIINSQENAQNQGNSQNNGNTRNQGNNQNKGNTQNKENNQNQGNSQNQGKSQNPGSIKIEVNSENLINSQNKTITQNQGKNKIPESELIMEDEFITIEQFSKIRLITATVVKADKIEGTDKLLKLMVDDGNKIRQVVSGIAKYFSTEELEGRQVILVANLKPVRIKGIESEGMILATSDENGLSLLTTDRKTGNGAQIK